MSDKMQILFGFGDICLDSRAWGKVTDPNSDRFVLLLTATASSFCMWQLSACLTTAPDVWQRPGYCTSGRHDHKLFMHASELVFKHELGSVWCDDHWSISHSGSFYKKHYGFRKVQTFLAVIRLQGLKANSWCELLPVKNCRIFSSYFIHEMSNCSTG